MTRGRVFRRAVPTLTAAVVLVAAGIFGSELLGRRVPATEGARSRVRPETWTTDLAATMSPADLYSDPDDTARAAGVAALGRLLAGASAVGAATESLRSLGFTTGQSTDPDTGRAYVSVVCRSETCPGWGVLLVDLSAPIRLAIEVPHPRADLDTERVGLDLFRRVPGAVLIMAGAHRRAADGLADVAHNAASMFNAFASVMADRGIPQAQLHGFADESLPGADVVVSTGQGTGSAPAERLVAALEAGGLKPCQAWRKACGRLEGTTNVQGTYAAGVGAVFLHIEINYSIRGSAARRAALVGDLAAADLART